MLIQGCFLFSVFRSKKGEMDWVIKRAGLETNNLGDAVVKLRGLPFGCSKEEIAQFFTGVAEGLGLLLCPERIQFCSDQSGYEQCFLLPRSEQISFIWIYENER